MKKTKTQRTLEFLMGTREPTALEIRQENEDVDCDNVICESYGDKPICYNPIYRDCGNYK